MPDLVPTTRLLNDARAGDAQAASCLWDQVYAMLHDIAQRRMRSEREGHTLQTTALVNEAYARLVNADVSWQSRAHFLAVAAQAMRRILLDHARSQGRAKRGGGATHIALDDVATIADAHNPDFLDLEDALQALGQQDPRKEKVIELHYYGGLSHPEIAEALDISPATVDRDLRMAKAWLKGALSDGRGASAGSPEAR